MEGREGEGDIIVTAGISIPSVFFLKDTEEFCLV